MATTDDYASNGTTTGILALNGQIAGDIETVGDADWFSIDLIAGKTYLFKLPDAESTGTTLGSNGGGRVMVYTGDTGQQVTPADFQRHPFDSAFVTYSPTVSGTYFVAVTGHSDIDAATGTGTYKLQASEINAVDDYLNNHFSYTTLTVGGSVTGGLQYSGDEDWFKLNLTAGKTYLFEQLGAQFGGGTLGRPSYLALANQEGNIFITYAIASTAADTYLPYEIKTTGTYYLVLGSEQNKLGTYTLRATEVIDDFGESKSSHGELKLDVEISGNIETQLDKDWFRIELESDASYSFFLLGDASDKGTLGTIGQTNLVIYDVNGAVVQSAREGVNTDPAINFSPENAGIYYVEVSEYHGIGSGTYKLKATQVVEPDDYADDKTTTTLMPIGGKIQGELEEPGDQDWFKVQMTAGQLYYFELQGKDDGIGTLIDPSIAFYNPDGQLNEIWLDFAQFVPPTSGTYYVAARGFDGNETGTYTLRSWVDDYTWERPGSLTPNKVATGQFEWFLDEDWFKVTLTAGRTYRLTMDGANTDGTGFYPRLNIHKTDLSSLVSKQFYTVTTDKSYSTLFIPEVSGEYYLRLYGNSGLVSGSYQLSLTPDSDTDDYADNQVTTAQLPIEGQLQGKIETESDRDWFKIELTAGKLYGFEVGGPESGSGTLEQSNIYLYDANGNYLTGYGNSVGNGYSLGFEYLAKSSGTYYLQVSSYRNFGGDFHTYVGTYTLRSHFDDFGNNYQIINGELKVGTSVTGELEIDWDSDWFAIDLEKDQNYVFRLRGIDTGGGTSANPTLDFFNKDKSFIKEVYDKANNGVDPFIEYTPKTSGTYFLSSRLGSGTYTMEAWTDDYTTSQWGELKLGEFIKAELNFDGDSDRFKTNLLAGSRYYLDFNTLDAQGGLAESDGEITLAVAAPNGTSTFHPTLEQPRFLFTAANSGEYEFKVSGSDNGDYQIKVSEAPSDDFAGNSSTTGILNIDGQTTGALEIGGDSDWFKITLTTGNNYLFELLGADGNGGTLGATGEAQLSLYNSTGAALLSTANGGTGGDPLLSFSPSSSGIYYLSAEGINQTETGTYTVRASLTQNNFPTGQPFIFGDANPGKTLLAETRGITDADGLGAFSFQWLRNGEAISGANTSSYRLRAPDVDEAITVQVSYTDGAGYQQSLLSDARIPVISLNDAYTDLIEMYVIILGRAPDQAGLEFWSGLIDGGLSFEDVADEMWNSSGAKAVYLPTLSEEQQVATVYRNVLARDPDEEGLAFWLVQWQDDDIGPVATMLEMINALTANNSSDPQAIQDKILFEAKVDIGGYLATSVGNDNVELAAFAFDYLETGHSVGETRLYVDQQLSVIGQENVAVEGMI